MHKLVRHFKNNPYLWVLLLIVIIAAVIRLSQMGKLEMWYDEAYSGLTVRQSWPQMWQTIVNDVHPPLYYFLLKLWVTLLGNTEAVLRSFSILCGILILPASYALQRELGVSKSKSLLAPALFAITPLFIEYSLEIRSYSLFTLLYILAAIFLFRIIRHDPFHYNRDWFIFSILLAALIMTHYVAAFGILVVAIYLAVATFRRHKVKRWLLNLVLAGVPVIVSFLAWLPVLIHQLIRQGGLGWIPKAELPFILRSIAAIFMGVDNQALGMPPVNLTTINISPFAIGGAILILMLVLHFFKIHKKIWPLHRSQLAEPANYILILCIAPILLVILLSQLDKVHFYVERYIIAYLALFVCYVSLLLGEIDLWIQATILFIYLVLLSYVVFPARSLDASASAQFLNSHIKDEQIVMTDPISYVVLRYYLDPKLAEDFKLYDQNGAHRYETWAIIDPSQIVTDKSKLETSGVIVSIGSLNPDLNIGELVSYGQWHVYQTGR